MHIDKVAKSSKSQGLRRQLAQSSVPNKGSPLHPPLSQRTTEILVGVPVVPVLSVVEGAVVPASVVEVANRLEVLEVLEVTAPGRFPWTMSS